MNKFRRSAAPSPEAPAASNLKGLPQSPPINSVLQNYWRSAPTPGSPEAFKGYRSSPPHTPPPKMPRSLAKKRKQWRSVRIPDFAQLLYRVRVKSDGAFRDYFVGVLLLVEIKKAKHSCQMQDFFQVMDQTGQQARHSFSSYQHVSVLG